MEIGAHTAARISNVTNLRRITRQMPLAADAMNRWQKAVNRAMSANAPPGAGLQVGLATNQLDRVLTHMHPSLAFDNIRAAARAGTISSNRTPPIHVPNRTQAVT